MYTVFDGHGGCDASSYAAAHFLFTLIKQTSADKSDALIKAFVKTDTDFCVRAVREVSYSLLETSLTYY